MKNSHKILLIIGILILLGEVSRVSRENRQMKKDINSLKSEMGSVKLHSHTVNTHTNENEEERDKQIKKAALSAVKDFVRLEQKIQIPLSYLNDYPERNLHEDFYKSATDIQREYDEAFGKDMMISGNVFLLKAGLDLYRNDFQSADKNLAFAVSEGGNGSVSNRIKAYVLMKTQNKEYADPYLNNALKMNPLDHIALNLKGELLLENAKYEEALECADRAIKISPENYKAWENKCLAMSALKIDKGYKEATEKLNTLKGTKEVEDIRDKYADTNDKERIEKLISVTREINSDPTNAENWAKKAGIFYHMNKQAEALECYNKSLKLDEKNASAWLRKGLILSGWKQYEEAIKCFDKAIELKPKYLDYVYHEKGCSLKYQGKYKEAIECYDEGLKHINNDESGLLNCKALAMAKMGEVDAAIQLLDSVIERFPDKGKSYYNKACIYSLAKQKEKMIEGLKKTFEVESHYRNKAEYDPDFDNYKNDEDFKNLLKNNTQAEQSK